MAPSRIPRDESAAEERLADDDLLEAIEGRWTLQVLLCLKDGAHRFSDLKASIPRISSNVLTDRIRALEQAGLIERQYLPPPSASHVYQLAAAADGLRSALDALASWRAEGAATGSFHTPACEVAKRAG
jgi:DNA-binding HxlR family transcriptional regulator